MDIELANLLKAKKAAVMASKDTSVIDANIEKVRKTKYAAASTPKQISAVENNEEMEENKHGIYVIDSLGYDEDDNEHFEVNVNGKTIVVIEEPDQILHSSDNSELLDKHYDDIKDVIGSYHRAKSKTTTPGENAESKPKPQKLSPKQKKLAAAASPRNKITGADFKALAQDDEQERRRKASLSHESTQITNFIKAVSQKNYASAHKYLQGVVEAKLKKSISNALNK